MGVVNPHLMSSSRGNPKSIEFRAGCNAGIMGRTIAVRKTGMVSTVDILSSRSQLSSSALRSSAANDLHDSLDLIAGSVSPSNNLTKQFARPAGLN